MTKKPEESLISDKENNQKKKYIKPEIQTEKLNTFGASCNGTTNGGRKVTATPSPPPLCNPSRLTS